MKSTSNLSKRLVGEARYVGHHFSRGAEFIVIHDIHSKVAAFSVPNYKGARIQVPSGLNISEWHYLHISYDLQILAEYLQFGFSLNVDYDIFQFNMETENHASALQRPDGVNKYFNTEIEKQAMVGPIEELPFEKLRISPLMARDKPDGGVRVIVDLSWPLGQSVNSCVSPDVYDGIPFTLKYPTVDDVIQQIRTLGPRTLLFKIDLERAFRNLRIDPFDYPLLGLQWQGKRYVDVGLPFGFRTGAAACQMCTDVITHQLRLRNVWVINYLDDYIGVSSPQNASNDFHTLKNLLQKVGLPINQKKMEEPGEQITC